MGFAGSCHPELTGVQNVRFVARVYGVETDDLVEFVRDFAELGEHFNLPVRSYSSGMKSRLAFGMSMGIKFDTYLVDEVTAVGVTRNCSPPGEGRDGISSAESRVAQRMDPFPLCGRHSGILISASRCRVLAVGRGKSTGGL